MASIRNENYLVKIQVMGCRLGYLKRVVGMMADSVRKVTPVGRKDRHCITGS